VLDTARAAGWPAEQLHYEFFAAEVEHRADDESFEVEVASSGQVVRVTPAQTVVQALESIGVCVQTSCEQGVCGTCLTRVISGQPDHRDMYLTEDEQAAFRKASQPMREKLVQLAGPEAGSVLKALEQEIMELEKQ